MVCEQRNNYTVFERWKSEWCAIFGKRICQRDGGVSMIEPLPYRGHAFLDVWITMAQFPRQVLGAIAQALLETPG